METLLYVEKTLSADRDADDGAHDGSERRPERRPDERRGGLAKEVVAHGGDVKARGGSRGRRATGRVPLALVALAAYAAATLLLYALIVRWPWLMVACLAVALVCAVLALAVAAALLVARLRRGGRG